MPSRKAILTGLMLACGLGIASLAAIVRNVDRLGEPAAPEDRLFWLPYAALAAALVMIAGASLLLIGRRTRSGNSRSRRSNCSPT